MKKAFTMIELIFVIVILGIISSIAISKMAVTRDDAIVAKGRSQIAAIRNTISLTRNTNMLMGKGATYPARLDALGSNRSSDGDKLFDHDTNAADSKKQLLDYPVYSKSTNGWRKVAAAKYTFNASSTDVDFTYTKSTGNFDCNHADANAAKKKLCKDLTE